MFSARHDGMEERGWRGRTHGRYRTSSGHWLNRCFRRHDGKRGGNTSAVPAAGEKQSTVTGCFSRGSCTFCELESSGMHFHERSLRGWDPQPSMAVSSNGPELGCSKRSGGKDLRNTMNWRVSHGNGSLRTEPTSKLRWRKNPWDRIPRTGEKNGSKRHALVDARGVPLSLVVSGANVHDSKMIGVLLDARVVRLTGDETVENLCLDAGYVGMLPGL